MVKSDRLAALFERDAATKAKIGAEQERLRQLEAKLRERQFRIVGEACCKVACRDAAFAAALKAVLETDADQRAQAFLRQRGIL
jgi:hypothetical protein